MTLRLPADLRDILKRLAQEDDRSLHSLILHALRQYAGQRATEKTADR
jgi:predicted transcriptional regulator